MVKFRLVRFALKVLRFLRNDLSISIIFQHINTVNIAADKYSINYGSNRIGEIEINDNL